MTPRKHKHADMMRRWLDDASLEVEIRDFIRDKWGVDKVLTWREEYEYRFAPKMIKCGDLEFPKPIRVEPRDGDDYWRVCLDYDIYTKRYTWASCGWDKDALKRGICHSTKEAAEAHARALIALTEVRG